MKKHSVFVTFEWAFYTYREQVHFYGKIHYFALSGFYSISEQTNWTLALAKV